MVFDEAALEAMSPGERAHALELQRQWNEDAKWKQMEREIRGTDIRDIERETRENWHLFLFGLFGTIASLVLSIMFVKWVLL